MAEPGRHRPRAGARPGRHRRTGTPRRPHRLATPAAALIAAAALTWHSAGAAFTAGTANPGNSWTTGTVALSDDDVAGTTVNLSNLMPNTPQTRCVTVTYTGTVVSPQVRLYAGGTTGTLGPYLRLTVEEGGGTPTNACAGFTPAATVYDAATPTAGSGTLGSFTVNRTSHATGVGAWAPTAPGQTRAYRFTLELIPDEAAQGSSISTTITWQARS